MTNPTRQVPNDNVEPGFDVPALPGMALHESQTPALLVDLDALDRNLERMRPFVETHGVRLRTTLQVSVEIDCGAGGCRISPGKACP